MQVLEVGTLYRSTEGVVWLAVQVNLMVTLRAGEVVESTATHYDPVRALTVEELLAIWRCSLTDLDHLTHTYFAEEYSRARERKPRGTARPPQAEDAGAALERLIHRIHLAR